MTNHKKVLIDTIKQLDKLGLGKFVLLQNNSKIPIASAWQKKNIKACSAIYHAEEGGNVGILIENGLAVIDVDVKNGKQGEQAFKNLEQIIGHELIKSVITQSGGWHTYAYFNKEKNTHYHQAMPENGQYHGIDFKSNGYCVLAGSVVDGNPYTTNDGIHVHDNIQEALHKVFAKVHVINNTKEKSFPKKKPQYIIDALKNKNPGMCHDEWFKILCAIKDWDKTSIGKEVAREWSKGSEIYNEEDFNSTWQSIKKIKGGVTVGSLLYDETKYDQFKSFCYVLGDTHPVYDANRDVSYSETQFANQFAATPYNQKTQKTLLKTLIAGEQIQCAHHKVYDPREPLRIFTKENTTYLNTYNKNTKTKPCKYDDIPDKFKNILDKHIAFITSNAEDYNTLFNWFAWQYQYPGIKIPWMPVIIGEQGIGKSTIGEILRSILGRANVGNVTKETLESDFNDYAEGSCVCFFEEMAINYKIQDKIKMLVTDPFVTINKKYAREHMIENVTNYIGFTNDEGAVKLMEPDRRYALIKSEVKGGTAGHTEYFANIRRCIKECPQAFAFEAQHRLCKDWIIKTDTAPESEFKKERLIIDQETQNGMVIVKNTIAMGGEYFGEEALSITYLTNAINGNSKKRVGKMNLARILKILGYHKLPQRMKINYISHIVYVKDEKISREDIKKMLSDCRVKDTEGSF